MMRRRVDTYLPLFSLSVIIGGILLINVAGGAGRTI